MSFILLALACAIGGLLWFVLLGKRLPHLSPRRQVLRFAPTLIACSILIFYFLVDRGIVPSLSDEYMFGLFVVFLFPLVGVLVLVQLAILYSPRHQSDAGGSSSLGRCV